MSSKNWGAWIGPTCWSCSTQCGGICRPNGRQAEAQDELKRYLSLSRTKSTTIAQLRKQQLSLADNSTWVAYNERLFEGLRKAGMPEE